jgi:hypothetical protein
LKQTIAKTAPQNFVALFHPCSVQPNMGSAALAPGAMVAESDVQATAPGDKADASKSGNVKFPRYAAGQECSNCSLYQGKAGDAAGSCQLLSGKQA